MPRSSSKRQLRGNSEKSSSSRPSFFDLSASDSTSSTDYARMHDSHRRSNHGGSRRDRRRESLGSGRSSGGGGGSERRSRRNEYYSDPEDSVSSPEMVRSPARKPVDEEEIYIVKQSHGYCSVLFSVVQTIILGWMMWQCQVAPFDINPMIGPYPDALSEWGGKNSILILEDGQWWRLVTPIFLHAGLIHLAGNALVQVETGAFFEQEWGSFRWLILYIASAVGSSILSVIVMPDAVSVGSSGAVMGLFGGKAAEVLIRVCEGNDTPQERLAHEVRREQCFAVTCGVGIVLLFSFIPYVDWAAHLGGLVAGFAVGMVIFAIDAPGILCKLFSLALGAVACVAGFGMSLTYMYSGNVEAIEELRDVCGYYKSAFEDYQCNCMVEEYLSNSFNFNNNNNDQGGN